MYRPKCVCTVKQRCVLCKSAPKLLEILEELVDASWNGGVEVHGLEEYTDPARILIEKIKKSTQAIPY